MRLKVDKLFKSYDDKLILNNINIDIKDRSGIALIGASGAGKSTLLRLLSLIEIPEQGKICVNDHHLEDTNKDEYYKKIGFVFQSHTLFPHLTVLRNITIILEKVHNIVIEDAEKTALELLTKFDLQEHIHKYPKQLSGGQSQRVSIVRSLALNPEVMFLDEPTSALDPVLTQEVLQTILKLREEHMNFVIVTHEILFAKKAADYIIFMQDGRIIEQGDVAILDNPQTKELKDYLSNVFLWE
ncbi:Arginine transport ATP-binding protein ArtM [Candidatus Izimaplasma bacterium HR1]|jgi:polar amino acid transport system ATP-binding protein|uniref:amino acid ABC transporter ATP-binding protein n=1 Tax=Candidatus Izimoplasma sp. HR1 TaxID=1541959 RepID=UPI0004F8E4B4|nr:Arginine transport ATP-binding protein ArtM [Candidatus Izimaplasma bacterium HR1]